MENTGLEFYVDVTVRRPRAVSISSVDSEPIKKDERRENSVSSAEEGQTPEAPLHNLTDCTAPAVDDEQLEPCIPIERVSEAPVAAVTSVSASSNSCVAEMLEDTIVLDAGTRLCLDDGTYVGTVTSVLGPVSASFYLISSKHTQLTDLIKAVRVSQGVHVHYDIANHVPLHNLAAQCDLVKGTDASYINDDELPTYVRPDFSDDEKEKKWKKENKNRATTEGSVSPVNSDADIEWDKVHWEENTKKSRADEPNATVRVPSWLL